MELCRCGHSKCSHSDFGAHLCFAEKCDCAGYEVQSMNLRSQEQPVASAICPCCGCPTTIRNANVEHGSNEIVPSVDRILNVSEGRLCLVCEELINSVIQQPGLVAAQTEFLKEQAHKKSMISGHGYFPGQ